eukprot:UN26353
MLLENDKKKNGSVLNLGRRLASFGGVAAFFDDTKRTEFEEKLLEFEEKVEFEEKLTTEQQKICERYISKKVTEQKKVCDELRDQIKSNEKLIDE